MSKLKNKKLFKFLQAPPTWFFIVAALAFVAVKLILVSAQKVYLDPDNAPIDDMLMLDMGISIREGNWLGDYSYLTLSKHSFFALWLAVLNFLKIPYLLGGHLLWAVASAVAAVAFAPALKKRWLTLGLFAVLWFNPAAAANPAQVGYITRVYRDNIFPALCIFCVAGIIGYALRYKESVKHSIGWLAVSGAGLAAAWLCREDGWWMLPFILAAYLVIIVFVLRDKEVLKNLKQKISRIALLSLPFIMLAAGLLAWCGMNQAYYGRFIISDFSSGEFADAVGAMTRIQLGEWDPIRSVPLETREYLYENVPEFAPLKPYLEDAHYIDKTNNHTSGGFYWALREAAFEIGMYDTPQKAQAYFSGLAADINALCDSGAVASTPRRSSVSPPIRAEYILPTLGEGLHSVWFCATFQQCEPYTLRSIASPEKFPPLEAFLHEKCLTAAAEGTDQPYYSPADKLLFLGLQIIRYAYALLVPLALVLAVAWQAIWIIAALKKRKKQQIPTGAYMLWWVMLGVLLCVFLRAFMVAFVSVSSFTVGTYIMYLSSAHPLLILYVFVGAVMFLRLGFFSKKTNLKGYI